MNNFEGWKGMKSTYLAMGKKDHYNYILEKNKQILEAIKTLISECPNNY
jgi:hypothetical protein